MKIYASKREYPTYEDYANSGRFTSKQLAVLENAFTQNYKNITPKKISIIANPEFSPEQMYVILQALATLPVSVVLSFADPTYSVDHMKYICTGYEFAVSDKVLDLIDSCSISYAVKFDILSQFLDSNWDYDLLYLYLGHDYPANFIEGASFWIDSNAGDVLLYLIDTYPNVFDGISAGAIEDIGEVIEEFYWEFNFMSELSQADLSVEQMRVVVSALHQIYLHKVPVGVLPKLLDSTLSLDEMRQLLS